MRLRRKPPRGNVRRVTSTGQNMCGVITNKAGHTVQFESFLERVLLLQFERDKSVIDYRSQPVTFTFTDEQQRERKYTPDFLVERQGGAVEIHEVTLVERQRQARIREREREAGIICSKKGWEYRVHTEQTLPKDTEITNLLALYPYRLKKYKHEGIAQVLREYLLPNRSRSLVECVKELVQAFSLPESTVFEALCHLLWEDEIATDLHTLLIVDCSFNPRAKAWLSCRAGKQSGIDQEVQG